VPVTDGDRETPLITGKSGQWLSWDHFQKALRAAEQVYQERTGTASERRLTIHSFRVGQDCALLESGASQRLRMYAARRATPASVPSYERLKTEELKGALLEAERAVVGRHNRHGRQALGWGSLFQDDRLAAEG